MKKSEISKLIATAITGQGSAIDAGGALDKILTAILDRAVPVEVEDITAIDGAILDSLEAGDVVVKVTGKQKHAYLVSYKGEGAGEGLCLTYADASVVETVSYDLTEGGWAYNSTDTTPIGQ